MSKIRLDSENLKERAEKLRVLKSEYEGTLTLLHQVMEQLSSCVEVDHHSMIPSSFDLSMSLKGIMDKLDKMATILQERAEALENENKRED